MDACDLTFPLICIQVAQLVVNDPITVYHGISRTPPGFYLIHTQFIYEIKLRYTRPTNCRDLGGPPIVHRLSGILQTDSAALFKIGAKKNLNEVTGPNYRYLLQLMTCAHGPFKFITLLNINVFCRVGLQGVPFHRVLKMNFYVNIVGPC